MVEKIPPHLPDALHELTGQFVEGARRQLRSGVEDHGGGGESPERPLERAPCRFLSVVLLDKVDEKGGGPAETVRTVARTGEGVEILVKTETDGQLKQIPPQGIGFKVVPVPGKTLGQHPVDVDPDGPPPVIGTVKTFCPGVVIGDRITVPLVQGAEGEGIHPLVQRIGLVPRGGTRIKGEEPGGGVLVDEAPGNHVEGIKASALGAPKPVADTFGGGSFPLEGYGRVLADGFCDGRKGPVGPAEYGVEKRIHDEEGALLADLLFVVIKGPEKIHQEDVTVVIAVGGSHPGRHVVSVLAGVGGEGSGLHLHGLQRRVPGRGVVDARLPGVANENKPVPVGASLPVQVLMQREDLRIDPLQKRFQNFLVAGVLKDLLHGHGVDGGHGDPRGHLSRGPMGRAVRPPEVRFREVVAQGFGVEHDLRQHAVGPLGGEEGSEFSHCLPRVVVGFAYGDKTRVPVPLMGIEGRGGFGIGTGPVPFQYGACLADVAVEDSGQESAPGKRSQWKMDNREWKIRIERPDLATHLMVGFSDFYSLFSILFPPAKTGCSGIPPVWGGRRSCS